MLRMLYNGEKKLRTTFVNEDPKKEGCLSFEAVENYIHNKKHPSDNWKKLQVAILWFDWNNSYMYFIISSKWSSLNLMK